MTTPNEQNQLRKGRAVALLIHYKNRLLGESGLPDEDTLTDLLTDICHSRNPSLVCEALRRSQAHHAAEVSAAAVSLPVTEAQGDDVCDQCMRSGVQVTRTDDAGKTACPDCDTVSLPADKAVWCIFQRCPDRQPAWHDEDGMPCTYPTKRAAELEIIDTLEELFRQVKDGERELGDVWGDDDWIEPVTLHPDGSITTEGGTTYGRHEDYAPGARPTFDHDPRFDEGGEFYAEANPQL